MNRRIPKKFQKELKDFKLRVGLAMYNSIQLRENRIRFSGQVGLSGRGDSPRIKIKKGNAEFIFDVVLNRQQVDTYLKNFTTTMW